LIGRLAKETPDWGSPKIHAELFFRYGSGVSLDQMAKRTPDTGSKTM
jgi:hypothetical protein